MKLGCDTLQSERAGLARDETAMVTMAVGNEDAQSCWAIKKVFLGRSSRVNVYG